MRKTAREQSFMFSQSHRNQFLVDLIAIVIAASALHVGLGLNSSTVAAGGLLDTDSYMRLIRVEALWQTGDWYQTLTGKLGAPAALSLHWTRPLDVIILLPAVLLHHLFGLPAQQALYWVGVAVSPILHLLACIVVAWAARPLFPQHGAWRIAALILLLSGASLSYSLPGRPDHHALCILLVALAARYAICGLLDPQARRPAYLAGAWSGFGIWVAPEIVLAVAPLLVTAGMAWAMAPKGAHWARFGRRVGSGMAAVIAAAIAIERPATTWLVIEYDKVSILHLSLALAVVVDFHLAAAIRWTGWRRFAAGAAIATATFALLLVFFPRFYLGSLGNIDAATAAVFIDDVSEMEPLWPHDFESAMLLLRFIGNTLLAVPVGLYFLWRARGGSAAFMPLLYLLLAYVMALAAALLHLRLSTTVSVFGAILGCGLFAILCDLVAGRGRLALLFVRLASYFVVAIGLQFIGMAFKEAGAGAAGKTCDAIAIAHWLRDARPAISDADTAPIIMTDSINPAPAIAYFSDYRLVGGPYHRGNHDVADMVATFATSDLEGARAILARREVDLVLVCLENTGRAIEESPSDALYHRLVDGKPPAWLRPVAITGKAAESFRLFAFEK